MITGFWQRALNISDDADFETLTLELFRYQSENVPVYKQFLEALKVNPSDVVRINDIPFLPVEVFKSHNVYSGESEPGNYFLSSGTTGMLRSKHYISDQGIYVSSIINGFEKFFGEITGYVFFGLLPSFDTNPHSSLAFMVEKLISLSKNRAGGFYLGREEELINELKKYRDTGFKVMLIGVGYALMDFAEKCNNDLNGIMIVETGGMKGQRKELIREELHNYISSKTGVEKIYSEYSMSELLSQAWSAGGGMFHTPPWMRTFVFDLYDPLSMLDDNQTGTIGIIDLANIHSCAFLSTKDIGVNHSDGSFEIFGRTDNSDLRGCNLLIG